MKMKYIITLICIIQTIFVDFFILFLIDIY